MTKDKWLFIGTDSRMSASSEIMSEIGYNCRVLKTDSVTDELKEVLSNFSPDNIVFPILQMKGEFPLELIRDDTQLYVGVASDNWLNPFRQKNFDVHHYLRDELFIWENALLTAEAFIAVYYSRTTRTIAGKHFYVAGYGRVGKMVADVLSSLGGYITIIVRADAQHGEAKARGFEVVQSVANYKRDSCLINTIPSKWLSITDNANLLIFDLASAPGCLTDVSMPEYYTLLPGLPGKYFPLDAATALADALRRIHRR